MGQTGVKTSSVVKGNDPRENRKIKVVPIKSINRYSMFKGNKEHDGSFMFSKTAIAFEPIKLGKKFLEIFTPDELPYLLEEWGAPDNDGINYYKTYSAVSGKELFWNTDACRVKLNRDGEFSKGYTASNVLDLTKLEDVLIYRILKSYTSFFAEGWDNRHNKATYKFCFVEEGEQVSSKISHTEKIVEVGTILAKLKNDSIKLRGIHRLINKGYTQTEAESSQMLYSNLLDIANIKEGSRYNPGCNELLTVLKDPKRTLKLFIKDALEIKELSLVEGSYFVSGNAIGSTIEDIEDYIGKTENKTWVATVKQKIMNQVYN